MVSPCGCFCSALPEKKKTAFCQCLPCGRPGRAPFCLPDAGAGWGREAAGAHVRPRPPHSLLFFAVLPGAALCGAACAHIRLRPWHLPPYCLPVGMAFAYRGGNGAPQCCLPLPGDLCFVRPQKAHRRHSVVLTARRPTAHLPPQKQRVTGPKIPCEKEKTQVVFFFFDFWEILTFIKTFCY